MLNQFNKNIANSLIYVLVNLFVGLGITSLAVTNLGLEVYGAWAILSVLMLLGIVGDQTIAAPIVHLLARSEGEGISEKSPVIYVNGLLIVLFFSLISCIVFSLFSDAIALGLFNTEEYSKEVSLTGPLLSLFLLGSLSAAVLNGAGRNDLAYRYRIVARLAQLLVVYFFLQLNFELFALIYGLAVHHTLVFLAAFIHSLRFTNIFQGAYNSNTLREILRLGGPALGGRIIGLFSDPLLKVIISKNIGLAGVGTFEVAQKVNSSVSALPVAATSNFPAQVMRINNGSLKPSKDIILFRRQSWITLLMLYTPILFLAQYFLELGLFLWLNEYSDDLVVTIRVLLTTYFLHSFSLIDLNIMLGFGKTKVQFYCNFITVIVLSLLLFIYGLFFDFSYLSLISIYSISIVVGSLFCIISTNLFLRD